MDQVQDFVRDYGIWIYLLLFAYCALKSGALPLFAGYAAQAELLALAPVVLVTFLGGYLGDELRFAVSRRYGDSWTIKWPRVRKAISGARLLVAKYGWFYIFLYRYPKGMRTIGALPVGLGSMSWFTFTSLNAASAAVWTALLVGVGYVFGAQIESAVQQGWGFVSIILLVVMAVGIYFAWSRIRNLQLKEDQNG